MGEIPPRLPDDRDAIGLLLAEAARRAAQLLLDRRTGRVVTKPDGTPVCAADHAADAAAKRALSELLPGIPVISEETVDGLVPGPEFILLDPLDGTREFLAGGDSYCVAIALVREGRPVAGAIAAPQLGRLWFAGDHAFAQDLGPLGEAEGEARRITVRAEPADGPVALVSRFHGDDASDKALRAAGAGSTAPMSSAVKFGMIASGEADLHLRGGRTMEWDIAAGEAILRAAGGVVLTLDGTLPRYGRHRDGYANPPFVAASNEALARRALGCCADASRHDRVPSDAR